MATKTEQKEGKVEEKEQVKEKQTRATKPLPVPQPAMPTTHTVQEGDTLSSIATLYNLSVGKLKKMNKLHEDIAVGDALIVE